MYFTELAEISLENTDVFVFLVSMCKKEWPKERKLKGKAN